LALSALETLDDSTIKAELIRVKGIGPWTADIYLLMALRRPDIWPRGDLALVKAVQDIFELPASPSPQDMAVIGKRWKPYRAVAARIMWHYYLSKQKSIH
jgi:DNA-3-methyladenine glycosylase II